MHLPRRACSLLGILCVVLCCLLYVADYYDYYYSRTAVPEQQQRHRGHEGAVADARAGPLLLPLAQSDARGGKTEGAGAREAGSAASHAPGEQRKRKDQTTAAKKKKRRCKKRKCKRTSAESEGDGDEADNRGDDDTTFTLNAVLDGAPVWSEFADRGYTIVGELVFACFGLTQAALCLREARRPRTASCQACEGERSEVDGTRIAMNKVRFETIHNGKT
nr:uncharacterized protein LOC113812575 [Penaeus vannamei]